MEIFYERNRYGMRARVIAFYLPQYHPIPENDKWWGKGFTEWTNVAKAKPLFPGHFQPKIPADLGFYDLRIPEVRIAQAELARKAGIEGFCYYHYWFSSDKQLLQRPFEEVLHSGEPDFPFCLCWANHDWYNKTWSDGGIVVEQKLLIKQEYNHNDYVAHFHHLLPAFRDKRYITCDGKPIFVIWHYEDIPNVREFISLWQDLAVNNGLKGIYFVANCFAMDVKQLTISSVFRKEVPPSPDYNRILDLGFDAINLKGARRAESLVQSRLKYLMRFINRKVFRKETLSICHQKDINKYLFNEDDRKEFVFPTLFPNWDHSPRSGKRARIYVDSTPEHFGEQIDIALSLIQNKEDEHKILFLQSWNEWGEGNYVEPDIRYGHGYLDVLEEKLIDHTL